jgi:hypothetical protein
MPAQAKASVWEDFLDIFYAPTQVFERRQDGKYGAALIILWILGAVLTYAWFRSAEPAVMGEVERGLAQAAQQNNFTPEQMEAGRRFGVIGMMITFLVSIPIVCFLVGLFLWLVGKLFDSQARLGQAIMVSTYAQIPRFILGSLVLAVQGFLIDMSNVDRLYDVTFSAARFAPEGTSELVLALLSRVEVFTIWATILLGIGLSVVGKIPKAKAMMAAFGVWLLAALPVLYQATRQG